MCCFPGLSGVVVTLQNNCKIATNLPSVALSFTAIAGEKQRQFKTYLNWTG